MARDLTSNQIKILEYIRLHIKEFGYPPTVRDICVATGIKSTSSVHLQLNNLESLGYIRRDHAKTRAIELIDENQETIADAGCTASIAQIPLVGTVAAGMPILAEQNIVSYYPIPEEKLPSNPVFMLKVKGESMINAGIFDGDYILIESKNTASDGEIIVALIDDSATVKTFYKEKDCIRLQPENDTMNPIILKSVDILGKVIAVFRYI